MKHIFDRLYKKGAVNKLNQNAEESEIHFENQLEEPDGDMFFPYLHLNNLTFFVTTVKQSRDGYFEPLWSDSGGITCTQCLYT